MNYKDKNVLVLAPHPDDAELGCGGTIARLLEEGAKVFCVCFSACEISVPDGLPKDIRRSEFYNAMDFLGIDRDRLIYLNYPVRYFPAKRQEILEDMVRICREIKPAIVFMPSAHDIHQDHKTIADEAMRAFKRTTLLGYEATWNNYTFSNQAFFRLEERHIRKKIDAVARYETQQSRIYSDEEFIKGLARTHGVQAGCDYAEVFEVVRWII